MIPLLLSLAVTGACYAASGVSLGLFFGPVLFLTFIAPAGAMADRTVARRSLSGAMLLLGVAGVWVSTAHLSAIDLIRCSAILGAYLFALIGAASGLEAIGVEKTLASALVIVTAVAWLTWPIWLSHQLSGPYAERTVDALAFAHPLLALNGVLQQRFNSWDRYTLAYQQLTTLNQDLLYAMPGNVWPTLILNSLIGCAGFGAMRISRILAEKRRPTASPASAAQK